MASLFMTSVAKDNLHSVQRSRFDVTTWFLRRIIRYREKVDIYGNQIFLSIFSASKLVDKIFLEAEDFNQKKVSLIA